MNQRSKLHEMVLNSAKPMALPIAVYPGMSITGANVKDVVTRAKAQVETQAALQKRYNTKAVLSAMDLSVEAEAFGCTIHVTETEIPSVLGRLVTTLNQAKALAVPRTGAARTGVYLDTVRSLRSMYPNLLVVAGCIGPFSLAARLAGVSEAMELTMTEPELMHELLEKSTRFLINYVSEFKTAGADALVMAEPAAGLLSPRGLEAFSSSYVSTFRQAIETDRFGMILHNCAAKALHLPAILKTGVSAFHFGAPMDMAAALKAVPAETLLCGNLDPTGVFCQMTPEAIKARATELLNMAAGRKNFVLSSGCDLPPSAPLASLDAFYSTVQ